MKKGQLAIWERSIDLYGAAVAAMARENAALRAERDKLREKGRLVCRAYIGIRAELDQALDWLNGQVAALRRGEE